MIFGGMIKMKITTILLLIVCGIVIALVSALYSQDMTVGLGASITGYGLPMLWLKKVTYIVPGTPDEYSLYGSGLYLLVDIVFWAIIVAIIYFAYKMVKK
jgi:ribose/xylose/arabinose/galactoside ABC-type transport system permease subunit